MYIIDEEENIFIPCDVIKEQVLTRKNDNSLSFNRKDMKVKTEGTLPLISNHFYEMVYKNNKIPLYDDLFNEYISKNNDIIKNYSDSLDGLKVRLSKFYVSLVREFYVRSFLKENGYNVLYNSSDDINHDVDAWVVTKKGKQIAISIYVKSAYSDENRKHKTNKRFSSVKYIDFAYNLDSSKGGCVYFPTKKDLNGLIEKIEENGN